MDNDPGYSIKVVARRTGLSPHVIRAWEKRYGVVAPARSETGRRLYSDAEIERLRTLHSATRAGHNIGQIAQLSTERLAELVEADRMEETPPAATRSAATANGFKAAATAEGYLQRCLEAIEQLDAFALEGTLDSAAVALGQTAARDCVVVPLVHEIGERWRKGTLRIAQEHLGTAIIRAFLMSLLQRARVDEGAPHLIVTTPVGQEHELGALLVAATAAAEGWKVTYLGPNLPSEEIAAAALHCKARAVALSIVYPADDPRLRNELRQLRGYLPHNMAVLVGGRAVEEYSDALHEIGAIQLADLRGLRSQLEMLRSAS